MENSILVNSEVFFDCDEIPQKNIITLNNQILVNLFPLYLLQEMVEEYYKDYIDISIEEIVNKIIEYRLNDA